MNNLTHRKNCLQSARLPKLDAGVPLTKIWIRAWLAVKIEPRHQISNNVVCASSNGSDQPAHTRSLFRAFASRLNVIQLLGY